MSRFKSHRIRRLSAQDFEFLVGTSVFRATPEEARSCLMAAMKPVELKAGHRLIRQGEEADKLYIIQVGSCIVSIERDGQEIPVCRLKPRDLVGEMAVITGEKRIANVDAETDMMLWAITREAFDEICLSYPVIRQYLTEVVAYRFTTSKVTASRDIGKYTIEQIIGRGGWSVVYRAVHSFLGLPVAIKMLKHDMAVDPEFLSKFLEEAKIIAKLEHENIVRVYDIEQLYKTVFIIMEYLDGMSLKEILDRRPSLSLTRTVEILYGVCSGLAYAHEQGIVHQDVNPSNVFIRKDERVTIVDFGLACPKGASCLMNPGTVYYMAPEQIQGDPVDERTDIYSLGITVYEMVTGRVPFLDHDLCKVMDAHVGETTPDPRKLRSDLCSELYLLIMKATRKAPRDRYQRMQDILSELVPLAEKVNANITPKRKFRRKMTGVFMLHEAEHETELTRLLEDFGKRVKELGVDLNVVDLEG